jgi:hypothetical protein
MPIEEQYPRLQTANYIAHRFHTAFSEELNWVPHKKYLVVNFIFTEFLNK